MNDQVHTQTKSCRSKELIALAALQRQEFLHAQSNLNAQVLWESCKEKDGDMVAFGYTENYARVATRVTDPKSTTNSIRKCHIGKLNSTGDYLWADV